MAKNIALGPWWAVSASLRASKYGDDIIEIKFQHDISKNTAYTYVDSANNNSQHWQQVIDLCNDNYRVKVGDLIYKTKNGKPILHNRTQLPLVDADTRVTVLDYEKDAELQAHADARQHWRLQQLEQLTEITRQDRNGRWLIDHLLNDPDRHIRSSDSIADIRDKLKLRSLLRFADMMNKGIIK